MATCVAQFESFADLTSSPVETTFADFSGLRPEFIEFFRVQHEAWALEDIQAAIDKVLQHCACLVDWMQLLVAIFDIKLSFDGSEPYISVADTSGWQRITDKIDPESVVAFLIAEHNYADRIEEMMRSWDQVTRISDRDLKTILDQGTTDYHVHLGGMRTAQALWRRITSSPRAIGQVQRFNRREMDKLSRVARVEREGERSDLRALALLLQQPHSPLGILWSGPIDRGLSPKARIHLEVLRERNMLARAWNALITEERARRAPVGVVALLEHQLDQYMFQKSLFLEWHRQPEKTNPGLASFRGFYHSTQPVWTSGPPVPAAQGQSARLASHALAEYAAYIAQNTALRRLELRLGPLGYPRDYHDFFKAWHLVEDEFCLDRAGIEIGFAIHFKRSLDKTNTAQTDQDGLRLKRFLQSLDRDSALLHAYRRISIWKEFSHRIIRIDFAGAERDVPVSLASLCMNLTRSDPESLELLASGTLDPRLHRYWLWHQANGTAGGVFGRPALGQTCHAGEDFAHPLEGIYAIATAASALKMKEGDTIGHGLALGRNVATFNTTRAPRTLTLRGSQFDALLWLHHQLRANVAPCPAARSAALEDWLLAEAYKLYPKARTQMKLLSDIQNIDRCRTQGICSNWQNACNDLSQEFHHMEMLDDACIQYRSQRVPIAPIVYELTEQVAHIQKWMIKEIAAKGIVLEFNPSSNVRVGGTGPAEDIPFIAILKMVGSKALATINTDNPGVFGTRVENEYAILVRLLRDAGFDRAESLAIADRIRDVGRRFVYWPVASIP
jgi:hypothetical protein